LSFEFLNAFKFLKRNTIIHRLDPRTKLLFALVYTISALMFTEIVPLIFIFLSLLPFIVLGKLFLQWIKSLRSLAFLYLFILIINTLFITNNGFSFSLAMIIRISIMISAFSIFFLTVDPNHLALSLIAMKVPYEFAFSFSLAFRFVPTIAIEAQNIIDSQQSRGYEMQKKGIINQIKNLFPLLVPLIIGSIKRAFNVAEALESRAFGSKKERTFYITIQYNVSDWICTILLLFFLIGVILIRLQIIIMPYWFNWSLPV
jgi:energy-coupling factor transport system permease protein